MASSKMSTADQKALQELTADMQKVALNTASSSSAVNVTSESEWELTKSDSEVGKDDSTHPPDKKADTSDSTQPSEKKVDVLDKMLHKCLQDLTAKEEDAPQVKTEAWEADFDNDMLEDGPEQEKEVLTTKLGRKNLLQPKGSKGDGAETTDVDIAASTPLLPTSGKRKPSRPAQEAASKRSASVASTANKIGSARRPVSPPRAKAPPKNAAETLQKMAPPPKPAPTSPPATSTSSKASPPAAPSTAKGLGKNRDSPPVEADGMGKSIKWNEVRSKTHFLDAAKSSFQLDPISAEGVNTHVAGYYYGVEGWGVTHPHQLGSCVLKMNSQESHRWVCWHCSDSSSGRRTHLSFKTSAEQSLHWWKTHATSQHWSFCDAATALDVSTQDILMAILGVNLRNQPLPIGAGLGMLPRSLPSHPRGHNKLVFQPPWNKTITPLDHASEVGLPWHSTQAVEVKEAVTDWGWPLFFSHLLLGNMDVQSFLTHPIRDLDDYVAHRKQWHKEAITIPKQESLNAMLCVEQHAFMILLLKLLVTKALSKKMPEGQIKRCNQLLADLSPHLMPKAREELNRLDLGGSDSGYLQSIQDYTHWQWINSRSLSISG